MDKRDYEPFCMMLDDVWGFYPQAKQPTAGQKAMFFRALAGLTIAQVRKGFDGHVKDPQRGRFAPLPADIVAQLDGAKADDGRPGPEEAWVIAMDASDESRTLVWTQEIARAWGVARHVQEQGDNIGARLTFKEVYGRLVAEARAAGVEVQWQATLGQNGEQRDAALERAHAAGLLPKPDRMRELAAPDHALSPTNRGMPESVKKHLAELRERILAKEPGPETAQTPSRTFELIDPSTLPPGMRRHQREEGR